MTDKNDALLALLKYLRDDVLPRAIRNRSIGFGDIEEAQELVAEAMDLATQAPASQPAGREAVACSKCGVRQPMQHSPDCGRPAAAARAPARCIDCHEPGAAVCESCANLRCESVAAPTPPAVDGAKHGGDAGDGLRYVLCQVGFGEHYRDWLLIPHADGQYVTAAKLQPFSMAILRAALAQQAVESRSRQRRVAIEKGEPAPVFDGQQAGAQREVE